MIKYLPIFLIIITSCNIYNNPVDPKADNYVGYESVDHIDKVVPVVNSYTEGRAALISTKYIKATSYEFQIKTNQTWGTILESPTNVLDISNFDFSDNFEREWRVRGVRDKLVGNWSNTVTLDFNNSLNNLYAASDLNSYYSDFIYVKRDRLTWGNSWELKYIIDNNDPVIIESKIDHILLKSIVTGTAVIQIREKDNTYKGFWSKPVTINPALTTFRLKEVIENDTRFVIGSKNSDSDTPDREVVVKKGFLMGSYEVSNKAFIDVINSQLNNNKYGFVVNHSGIYSNQKTVMKFTDLNNGTQNSLSFENGLVFCESNRLDHPVVGITWEGAVIFTELLNCIEGWDSVTNLDNLVVDESKNGYRLPLEKEWELTARSDQDYTYSIGNTFDTSMLNSGSTGTVSVYNFSAMSGNVWEWCYNSYASGAYDQSNSEYKIVKGGSWREISEAYFNNSYRGYRLKNYTDSSVGFRVVFQYGK